MDLDRIKEMISPDMDRVERLIGETLSAESAAIEELVEHVSLFGGKRLRPALVLVVSKALNRTTDDHIKMGAVIELIHTASLVHDDILDDAAMRRQVASVNRLYGNHIPVLLGDLIYARAFALSLTLSTPQASRDLAAVTNRICSGEIEQMFHRGKFELREDEYFSIIEAKTASLYAAACRLSVIYSGGNQATMNAMERYGLALGVAFQIVDDCLDIVGDEHVVGKSLGTDTLEGKITLPFIRLSESLSPGDQRRLRELFLSKTEDDKNKAIAATFDLQSAISQSFEVADDYIAQALKELTVLPPSPSREALEVMAEFVLNRKL